MSESWVTKGAKAALVAAAGYTAYKFIESMAEEEHSFVPSGHFKTRTDRVAALRNGSISMPQTLGPNTFVNKDGLYIHWVKWLPIPGVHPQLKGIVVLCHGIAEYARRYEHVAQELTRKGFAVIAVDHQGHGQSEGDRCYFKKMEDLADDVLQLVRQEAPKHPDADLFLLGHSMGGCVAMHTYLKSPELWKGMCLSAPALGHDPNLPTALRPIARALGKILPKLPIAMLDSGGLLHSQSDLDAYMNSSLVPNMPVRARVAAEFMNSFDFFQQSLHRVTTPTLIMHGDADTLCHVGNSVKAHDLISSVKSKLVLVPGGYHEGMNEVDAREKAIKEMVNWFCEHA